MSKLAISICFKREKITTIQSLLLFWLNLVKCLFSCKNKNLGEFSQRNKRKLSSAESAVPSRITAPIKSSSFLSTPI